MSQQYTEMGGGEPYVYEALGESDHQIGVVPSTRQKTASEISEDESGDKTRKRSYSFGSYASRGDSAIMMEIRNLEERVQELHSRNSKLKSDLEASQDVCFNMLVEKDQLAERNTQQLKILHAKISELEENFEESQTACNASETRRKMVEERLFEIKRANQQLCDEADDYRKEIIGLSGEVEQCRKLLSQKDEEVQVISENAAGYIDGWIAKEKTELENKISELTGVINELKSENKNLMEEMSSQNADSYQQIRLSEEMSSINLVSTPSQTEYLSTDNSQQTDSENVIDQSDFGNELEMHDLNNSKNLVSTPSQTEYSSTDNSQQTDSENELDQSDFGNELEMHDLSNSKNLVSTPSQTEYSSTDNSQQTDSENELDQSEFGNELEIYDNSDGGPQIDTSSLSVSSSSTSVGIFGACHDLASLPSPSPDSVVNENTTISTVVKAVERILGPPELGAKLFIQLFVLLFVFYTLLWCCDPLQRTLEICTITSQYGRLEHPKPPFL